MKPALLIVLLVAFGMTGAAFGQEPVSPIDIRADSMTYRYLSPTEIEITAYVTVSSSSPSPASYPSDLQIMLGSNTVYNSPMTIEASGSSCSYDPDCNNPCLVEVSPGETVWDHCYWWNTWWGPSCDPNDPQGTCDPMQTCACGAQFTVVYNGDYNGETELVLVADSGGLVHEADETNNSCTKMCAPPPPEPVAPIDLKADAITYSFPGAGLIEIRSFFTIHAFRGAASHYTSDIRVRLGSNIVYSSGLSATVPVSDCSEDPDCNNLCEITVEPGNVVYDYCNWWHTWGGVYCDPHDPGGTCEPVTYCACGSQYMVVTTVAYSDETSVTLELDSDDLVYESDETNNVHYAMIAPISTTPVTWGAIKSLFGF
jgi:hypothetical protein